MHRIAIGVLIIAFIADFVYKNIYEISSHNNSDNNSIQNKDLPPFNPNTKNYINKPIHYIDYDELFYDDSDEQFAYIIDKINPTINVTISYDPKYYKTKLENITTLLYKEYSNFIISHTEHQIPKRNKTIASLLFYSQIIVSVFFMVLGYIKDYIPFIPEKLFSILTGFKLFFTVGSYLLHRYLIKKYSSSYAFEVFVNGTEIYSSIEKGKAPLYEDIIRILTNMRIYRN
jgi:hypothetical protein